MNEPASEESSYERARRLARELQQAVDALAAELESQRAYEEALSEATAP